MAVDVVRDVQELGAAYSGLFIRYDHAGTQDVIAKWVGGTG